MQKVAMSEEEIVQRVQAFKTEKPMANVMKKYWVMAETSNPQSFKSTLSRPPNCWALPIVILTSIAISLPNIANGKAAQLISSVSEGLSLVKLIENTLYEDKLVNIRNAAQISWNEIALYRTWQGINFKRMSLEYKRSKDILQELSRNARRTIVEFKRTSNDFLIENPLSWPDNIIAANAMYRITTTLLLSSEEENEENAERLFERLSVMIADIVAACFTNLASVILTKCHPNAIEKREKGVHEAFRLLGKTGQIFELLQRQKCHFRIMKRHYALKSGELSSCNEHSKVQLLITSMPALIFFILCSLFAVFWLVIGQNLTLLENSIKKDFLSANNETTCEILSSRKIVADSFSGPEETSVLPWIPQTTSAVALQLMELDSSIY
ncbi:UNVERIFIED_CONTAM: hypothetical protein Sradi_5243700 [Sesamum radiatum]|uniref:Uncharacterized protein n=1 Tax=Sesamum radiatum TaxID=300843 RepID=A0AAW2LM73_SESRA